MRLPNIRYASKMPRYEQMRFGGIDRRENMSDGSIYDMLNISTEDYPLLSTTENRRQKEYVYELPWHYGAAEKEYVIAGKFDGTDYKLWTANTAYSVGTVVGYNGKLYQCISAISASADYSAYAPPNYTTGWKEMTGNTFTWDGTWSSTGNYSKNTVLYYGGRFYRNITGMNLNPARASETWKKAEAPTGYKGSYVASSSYTVGSIVYYYSEFYKCTKAAGTYIYPTNTSYWTKLSEPRVWSEKSTYEKGTVIYFNGNFYEAIADTEPQSPATDSINWEHYSYAKLWYDGKAIEGLELMPGKKECAYLNGYIVILPDKMYYNIYNGKYGYLAGTKSGQFKTSDYKGFYYNNHSFDYSMVAGLRNGKNYTGNEDDGVKNCIQLGFSGPNSVSTPVTDWVSVDLRKIFAAGDVVSVNQTYQDNTTDFTVIRNGSYEVKKVYADALIFENNIFAAATIGSESNEWNGSNPFWYLGNIILSKGLPDMDYLCVSNNRMWGCKDETVYGSELGNCFSWQRYGGAATDPVALESGDIGSFTGCCEYNGYPTFFKENEMFRVNGSTPSTFVLTKAAEYGIKEGCAHSVCVVDAILFFLSPRGVCAYTGGVPAVVSDCLKRELSRGLAGTDGRRYYLSADEGGGRKLYVYDTITRIWTSEKLDDVPYGIAKVGTDLMYMSQKGEIIALTKVSDDFGSLRKTKKAHIEFGDYYENSVGTKDLGRVLIRASVDPRYGALDVLVQYDSDGVWHKVGSIYNQNTRKRVAEFGFFPRRCDHYRLRLECEGKFILYSIARQVKNN